MSKFCSCLVGAAVALVLASPSLAQSPKLLRDIRPGNKPLSSSPTESVVLGAHAVFAATDAAHGRELFKSDGTAQGTSLVKDIHRGERWSGPQQLTRVGSQVFFVADDGVHGRELWKSDGTAQGTLLVADLTPGTSSSDLRDLTAVGSILFFRGSFANSGSELWKSDGSSNGTVLVKDIVAGNGSSTPSQLTALGSKLFFTAFEASSGFEPWISDGTANGTQRILDVYPGAKASMFPGLQVHAHGGHVFFAALTPPPDPKSENLGVELWKSDGTAPGTVLVKDIHPTPAYSGMQGPLTWASLGTALFFAAVGGDARGSGTGRELWRTDGTTAGTTLVKDIRPGGSGSAVADLRASSDRVYFSARTLSHGRELWVSDGTEAGTRLLADLNSGTAGSIPYANPARSHRRMTPIGNTLFFTADDGSRGVELWKTNGTATSTQLVADIAAGSANGLDPHSVWMLDLAGRLFFSADDLIAGREAWTSDGTNNGTQRIVNLREDIPARSWAGGFVEFAGHTYFRADDGQAGLELWRSDGSTSGTALFVDIVPGAGSSRPHDLTMSGTGLYFAAYTPSTGDELWRSDGSATGTGLVADVWTGPKSSAPRELTDVGGTLFFSAQSDTGRELWKSRGTATTTSLVADLRGGVASSDPRSLIALGSTLFFSAHTDAHGRELFKSDGTTSGTVLVKDIHAGKGSALTSDAFAVVDGVLYFVADDGTSGRELWRSDGSSTGTYRVADIRSGSGDAFGHNARFTAVGSTLYFVADDGSTGFELWQSKGTASTTRRVADVRPGASGSMPGPLRAMGSRVLFNADDGTSGFEPWISDGTTTTRLRDIWPGSGNGRPLELVAIGAGATAYFRAADPNAGNELWKTDGTSQGTQRVTDIYPGKPGSYVMQAAEVLGRLWFVANDGTHGWEPWTLSVGASSKQFGSAFAGDSAGPELSTSDPRLGKRCQVRGERYRESAIHALLLGLGCEKPAQIGPGCIGYLDPTQPYFVLVTAPASKGRWQLDAVLPNSAQLAGLRLTLQSMSFPTKSSLGIDLSNGVRWSLGL